jgi:phosphohistidine phosphatase
VSPDHDRPLAARGRDDAVAVGKWLRSRGLRFSLAVVSTSTRTRETWDAVASAGVEAGDVRYDRRIYNAYVDDLMAVLADVPDDADTVLVVGHAPGIPGLAADLADPARSDPEAVETLQDSFPTSALAVLTFDGGWADLGPGQATLTDVAAPRG